MKARTRAAELQGHYAGPVSRLLAYGADLLVISVSLTVTLAMTQFAIEAATPWDLNFEDEGTFVLVTFFFWAAIYFGNSFVFGRTPGMSLLGLRIVRADGSEIDARHGLIRLLAFPLGFLTLGLGFLGIIVGRERKAIYDRIAGTVVVYDWDAEAMHLREIANRGGRRRALERTPEESAADA